MNDLTVGIRVFSATKAKDRAGLGDVVTEWIRAHPQFEIFDRRVLQSSDSDFHCLTIVLLFHYVVPLVN
ncbi:MAG TPA: hypothetical protein VFV99_07405 [Kofleriaceae bacterium]|nr:hypothetical protein [Kofleriaceae bacterium]